MSRISRPVLIGGVAGAMALVVVWMLVFWLPKNRAYDAASAAARDAQSQVQTLQSQYSHLKSEQQQIPTLQAELAKMTAAIPNSPQLAQIFLNINDAAVKSGVSLTSIAPSPPSASGATAAGPPSIKVSLALSGGYFQVLDFIDRLDALSRLVVIDSVGLNAGGANSPLTVSIAARMFTTQAPAATTPGAGTVGGGATTTTSTTVAGAKSTSTSTTATTAAP